jgi:undecaprenyl diphosphate synthase
MHVGIIMDGNGRWATQRGLPRTVGHRAGAAVVRTIVEAAARSSIAVLTLYAFSSDNWGRPPEEVAALMRLLRRYLASEKARCIENGIRVNVIGRRDRLDAALVQAIEDVEAATTRCTRLLLRLAVDYSARRAILDAARTQGALEELGCFERRLMAATHSASNAANLDLLIRTGGERRLSDFLLWESAYAELVFSDTFWPDFTEQEFLAALAEFRRRERRFGTVLAQPGRSQIPTAIRHAQPAGTEV